MEQEIPDYDLDSEDESWLNEQSKKMEITPLKFEEMMDRLEKGSGQQVSYCYSFFFLSFSLFVVCEDIAIIFVFFCCFYHMHNVGFYAYIYIFWDAFGKQTLCA